MEQGYRDLRRHVYAALQEGWVLCYFMVKRIGLLGLPASYDYIACVDISVFVDTSICHHRNTNPKPWVLLMISMTFFIRITSHPS